MAETAEQYLTRTMRAKGLDEATVSSYVSSIMAVPQAVDELNQIIKRGTDDFNSMQGRVSRADQLIRENQDWYQNFQQRSAELDAALAAAKNGNGHQPQNGNGGNNGIPYLTAADLDAQLQQLRQQNAEFVKGALSLATRHAAMFPGEELDVNALEKSAMELSQRNGGRAVPLDVAYSEFIKPRVEKKREEDWNKKLDEAKQAAVDDYKSKHNLPADPVPTTQSLLITGPDKSQGDGAGSDADLRATWRAAGLSARH